MMNSKFNPSRVSRLTLSVVEWVKTKNSKLAFVVCMLLFSLCGSVEAQIHRIGYLSASSAEVDKDRFAYFQLFHSALEVSEAVLVVCRSRQGPLRLLPARNERAGIRRREESRDRAALRCRAIRRDSANAVGADRSQSRCPRRLRRIGYPRRQKCNVHRSRRDDGPSRSRR